MKNAHFFFNSHNNHWLVVSADRKFNDTFATAFRLNQINQMLIAQNPINWEFKLFNIFDWHFYLLRIKIFFVMSNCSSDLFFSSGKRFVLELLVKLIQLFGKRLDMEKINEPVWMSNVHVCKGSKIINTISCATNRLRQLVCPSLSRDALELSRCKASARVSAVSMILQFHVIARRARATESSTTKDTNHDKNLDRTFFLQRSIDIFFISQKAMIYFSRSNFVRCVTLWNPFHWNLFTFIITSRTKSWVLFFGRSIISPRIDRVFTCNNNLS